MSRFVRKAPSVCTDRPLNNSDVSTKLRSLKQLLTSCLGPTGRLKHVQNNIGGHVVTTSSSSSSILHHVSRFSDCGLFAAVLCLSLIQEAKQSVCEQTGEQTPAESVHL
uniref:Uncharacterized protein n=1 Tax=Labrus bergylta TaxID=56723 RepID=A0A3Q3FC64_9LABR